MHYLFCTHVNMLLPLMMIHNIWLLLLLCTFYYYSVLMIFYKHCLVSSGDTGWTHLCRSHHDRQAEWILRSSCFHYFTLNVKWYYMQEMCWGIYLYYHQKIKTSSYLGFQSVGSKVILPAVYWFCKIHFTWIVSSFSKPQIP